MAKSKTKFFEIIVSQARQNFEVDIVLREHLRVLAEAKSFDDIRGTVHAFSDPDSTSGYLVTRYLLAVKRTRRR